MTSKKLKELVGGKVALIPQGNNARGSKPLTEQITTTTLIKARGQRATVEGIDKSFNIEGDIDQHNCGYKLYETEAFALQSLQGKSLLQELKYFDFAEMATDDYAILKSIVERYR